MQAIPLKYASQSVSKYYFIAALALFRHKSSSASCWDFNT